MKDYEKEIEIIYNLQNQEVTVKTDPYPEKPTGNFTFRITEFSHIPIQITSKKHVLMLFGVKHDNFLEDLTVIKKFVSLLKELYPNGIHFKLHKIFIGDKDKDRQISIEHGQKKLLSTIARKALHSSENGKKYINELWNSNKDNLERRNKFIEQANNYFAQSICEDGFQCRPDGTIKVDPGEPFLLAHSFAHLLIENMDVKEECYLAKHYQ